MSNEMFLIGAKFHIDRGQERVAETAIRAAGRSVLEKKGMRAGDIQERVEGTGREVEELTLDELVECWGWSLIREFANETDEIIGIQFLEDFSTDEETLFETLGPCVSAGSYIDLEGNSTGGYWKKRYGFTGKGVVELEPVFPPVPLSQFSRDKIQAVIDAALGKTGLKSDLIDLYQIATGYVVLALTQGRYYLYFLVEDEGELRSAVHISLVQAVTPESARSLTGVLAERCLGATKMPLQF